MRRIVAIANGKGGVGKTSLTAGLAGLVAAAGYRVLTLDADPQGNLRRDLGYSSSDGQNLAMAIQNGVPLAPLRDVRPNLDCIPGGQPFTTYPQPSSPGWHGGNPCLAWEEFLIRYGQMVQRTLTTI